MLSYRPKLTSITCTESSGTCLLFRNESAMDREHDPFVVRRATSADDLQFVEKMAKELRWPVAQGDFDAFFSADPTGFFIGELKGQKISHLCVVKYPHYTYVGVYIVDQAYRRRGYGIKTWKHALSTLEHGGSHSTVIVAVPPKNELFATFGFQQKWINKRYLFKPSKLLAVQLETVPYITVTPASTVDFEKLVEYDAACFGASRQSFLQKWIGPPGGFGLVATDEDKNIIGYTVARKVFFPENYYKIGPLFANECSIASALLREVAEQIAIQCSQEAELSFVVPVTGFNTAAAELPEELGGVNVSSFIGMCKNKMPPSMVAAGFSKVFAVTSQEIG